MRPYPGREIMAKPKDDKHKEYSRYAAHCLAMVASSKTRKLVFYNATWRPSG
jgi:hypothetical protein